MVLTFINQRGTHNSAEMFNHIYCKLHSFSSMLEVGWQATFRLGDTPLNMEEQIHPFTLLGYSSMLMFYVISSILLTACGYKVYKSKMACYWS